MKVGLCFVGKGNRESDKILYVLVREKNRLLGEREKNQEPRGIARRE